MTRGMRTRQRRYDHIHLGSRGEAPAARSRRLAAASWRGVRGAQPPRDEAHADTGAQPHPTTPLNNSAKPWYPAGALRSGAAPGRTCGRIARRHTSKEKPMRVVETRVYRGPSPYGYRPLIRLTIDLEELEQYPSGELPNFNDRLI